MGRKKDKPSSQMIKTIYFDEEAAQDYLDIKNGGRFDWSSDENKEKISKIICEIDAKASGGFNFLSFFKATLEGRADFERDATLSKIVDSTLKNTLLSDYIQQAECDVAIRKFTDITIYPPENSFTMYKLLSSYLTVVPKDQLPIDMEKLNEAVLGERGYYEMFVREDETIILRFNSKAFRNNYNLTDLTKMNLIYYGVRVGAYDRNRLGIDKEFQVGATERIDAGEVFGECEKVNTNLCDVYDVVLAGVIQSE